MKEYIQKVRYLQNNVFYDLQNLNDGFDAELIYYFSEDNFAIVLQRAHELEILIMGIEIWLDKQYYDTKGACDYGKSILSSDWYQQAFIDLKKQKMDFMYSASYRVPRDLLE